MALNLQWSTNNIDCTSRFVRNNLQKWCNQNIISIILEYLNIEKTYYVSIDEDQIPHLNQCCKINIPANLQSHILYIIVKCTMYIKIDKKVSLKQFQQYPPFRILFDKSYATTKNWHYDKLIYKWKAPSTNNIVKWMIIQKVFKNYNTNIESLDLEITLHENNKALQIINKERSKYYKNNELFKKFKDITIKEWHFLEYEEH